MALALVSAAKLVTESHVVFHRLERLSLLGRQIYLPAKGGAGHKTADQDFAVPYQDLAETMLVRQLFANLKQFSLTGGQAP